MAQQHIGVEEVIIALFEAASLAENSVTTNGCQCLLIILGGLYVGYMLRMWLEQLVDRLG